MNTTQTAQPAPGSEIGKPITEGDIAQAVQTLSNLLLFVTQSAKGLACPKDPATCGGTHTTDTLTFATDVNLRAELIFNAPNQFTQDYCVIQLIFSLALHAVKALEDMNQNPAAVQALEQVREEYEINYKAQLPQVLAMQMTSLMGRGEGK